MSQPFSVIQEDGSCLSEYRDIVSDDELRRLMELILFNRLFDQRMVLLQRQGRLGFFMTSTGEESLIVGSAFCLQKKDPIFLTYRELGALLVRGVPVEKVLDQLYGNSGDTSKGRQLPVHYTYSEYDIPSISSPVTNQLPQACGYAYANKIQKTGQVSLAYIGEGSTSEGDFHVALNFSGVFQAPVVYLIRNNGYAISTPQEAQTVAKNLADRAIGYGIPGVQVNGNDLLAVIKVVRDAVNHARNGGGPTLIEALTYRLGAHSTSDDPSGYRTKEEEKEWEKHDNVAILEKHGHWRGVWSEAIKKEKTAQFNDEITALIKVSEAKPLPPLRALFEDVLEEITPGLQKQKEEYEQYLRAIGRLKPGEKI